MKFTNIFPLLLSLLFISCDIKEDGITAERILEVSTPYGQQLITNYPIDFTAKNLSGTDLTSNATFYINGQAQTGHQLVFSQTGTFEVTASIELDGQTINSQVYTVNVINPTHSTKILVEDYTGTWCTNCPRVAYKLDQAVSQNHHIIPVAIHYSRWQGDDPFGFDEVTTLTSDFNISGLPSPVINRTRGFIWNEQFSTLETELNKTQPLGLSISSNINGNQISADISVHFDMNMSHENLHLVLYLTENGLHADQANATNFYGGQNPIPDFEQKYVLRSGLNGLYGTAIPANETVENHTFTYHFLGDIPSKVTDINHCDLIAFVIKGNDQNAVLINIQHASVNTTQNFD
jgi:hypothetical protein